MITVRSNTKWSCVYPPVITNSSALSLCVDWDLVNICSVGQVDEVLFGLVICILFFHRNSCALFSVLTTGCWPAGMQHKYQWAQREANSIHYVLKDISCKYWMNTKPVSAVLAKHCFKAQSNWYYEQDIYCSIIILSTIRNTIYLQYQVRILIIGQWGPLHVFFFY